MSWRPKLMRPERVRRLALELPRSPQPVRGRAVQVPRAGLRRLRADLAAGRLVRLVLPEAKSALYSFQVMYRTDQPPGAAAAWLIERFVDQVR